MRQIKHPMSRAIYEFDEDYNVLVTTKDGKTGTFDPEGRYLHGEVKAVDPEMARWVGLGPREPVPITQNRRFMGAAETAREDAGRQGSTRCSRRQPGTRRQTVTTEARPNQQAATDDGFIENGTGYQRLLDTDTHPVPDILREESYESYEDQNFVPVSRYISRKYHELETRPGLDKVWQMACREEEIPEPGDTLVYEICEKSILIVRGKDMSIRAFYNSCLHRGRTLRKRDGPAGNEIRCPFHGFAWNFDGSLKSMTCAWDFPQVDQGTMDLPQVKVGTWGGFVFINMDPAC